MSESPPYRPCQRCGGEHPTDAAQVAVCGAVSPSCGDDEVPNPPDGPYICDLRGPHEVHRCRAHGCLWQTEHGPYCRTHLAGVFPNYGSDCTCALRRDSAARASAPTAQADASLVNNGFDKTCRHQGCVGPCDHPAQAGERE